ncbi:hypothetical protein [Acidisphaera sp. S103]|uniref:hypothetical protein n=1 Tax=Acidisphaera sp. S103 TaxID=1747223 RepID=UPI00131CD4D8|nr:hypothetical protein [Acidisphaera sp. S103]
MSSDPDDLTDDERVVDEFLGRVFMRERDDYLLPLLLDIMRRAPGALLNALRNRVEAEREARGRPVQSGEHAPIGQPLSLATDAVRTASRSWDDPLRGRRPTLIGAILSDSASDSEDLGLMDGGHKEVRL